MQSFLTVTLLLASAFAAPTLQVVGGKTVAKRVVTSCSNTFNTTALFITNFRIDGDAVSMDVRGPNLGYAVHCDMEAADGVFLNIECAAPQDKPNGGDVVVNTFDTSTNAIELTQTWNCPEFSSSGGSFWRVTARGTVPVDNPKAFTVPIRELLASSFSGPESPSDEGSD